MVVNCKRWNGLKCDYQRRDTKSMWTEIWFINMICSHRFMPTNARPLVNIIKIIMFPEKNLWCPEALGWKLFHLVNIFIQVLIKHFDLYDKSLSVIWYRIQKRYWNERSFKFIKGNNAFFQSHVFIYGTSNVCDG